MERIQVTTELVTKFHDTPRSKINKFLSEPLSKNFSPSCGYSEQFTFMNNCRIIEAMLVAAVTSTVAFVAAMSMGECKNLQASFAILNS